MHRATVSEQTAHFSNNKSFARRLPSLDRANGTLGVSLQASKIALAGLNPLLSGPLPLTGPPLAYRTGKAKEWSHSRTWQDPGDPPEDLSRLSSPFVVHFKAHNFH